MFSPTLNTKVGHGFTDSRFVLDDEKELSEAVSQDIALRLRTTIAQMSFYGAYFLLCTTALYTIINRPAKSRQMYILLLAVVVTFTLVTIESGLDIALLWARVQTTLLQNQSLSMAERVSMFQALEWRIPAMYVQAIVLGTADCGLLYLITDILTVWRAISIWRISSSRILPMILYSLLFGSFACDFAYRVLYCLGFNTLDNTSPPAIAATIGSIASISANLVATGMIGYVARTHLIMQSQSGLKLSGAKILVLLTESGLFYAVIQILRLGLALSYTTTTPSYGSLAISISAFQRVSNIVTASYTPALVLIINHGLSIADGDQPLALGNSGMKSLEFAGVDDGSETFPHG